MEHGDMNICTRKALIYFLSTIVSAAFLLSGTLGRAISLREPEVFKPAWLKQVLFQAGEKIEQSSHVPTAETKVTVEPRPFCPDNNRENLCYAVTLITPQGPRLSPVAEEFLISVIKN